MTMGKIAISLPVEQIDLAKRRVAEGHAKSVSAFISRCITLATPEEDSMKRLLADMAEEFGELTEDDWRDAREWKARVEAKRAGHERHA